MKGSAGVEVVCGDTERRRMGVCGVSALNIVDDNVRLFDGKRMERNDGREERW